MSADELDGSSAPALRRAVRILDYVSSAAKRPNAADLTRAIGIPKSSAHGLIATMLDLQLLARLEDGSFRLGPHLLRWANGFLSQLDIVSAFQEYFLRAPELSLYTVTLTVRDGAEVTYLSCRNSDQPLGVTFRIGLRLPAAFTATGKALLAELPEATLQGLLGGAFPAPLTQYSVRNLTALQAELAQIRTRGFSIDDGQVREGMICLGAALRDHNGKAAAGIAISLTRSEATPGNINLLGKNLQDAAAELSRSLGAA